MKTNSIIKSALFVAGFSAFALIGSAQAQVINVDFNASGGTSGTYSGQGAYSDPGHNVWNGLTVATSSSAETWSSLETSTGAGTSIGVTLTPTGGGSLTPYDTASDSSPALVAPALLNDFAYEAGTVNIGFSFSGLNAGDTYALYIYSQNGGYDSSYATFTIGSTSNSDINEGQRTGNASYDTSFVLGNNYVLFTGLTGSTSISGSLASVGNAPISGFQLVDTTPAAAPEPSSTALLLLGAGCLGTLMVRRAKGGLGLIK